MTSIHRASGKYGMLEDIRIVDHGRESLCSSLNSNMEHVQMILPQINLTVLNVLYFVRSRVNPVQKKGG